MLSSQQIVKACATAVVAAVVLSLGPPASAVAPAGSASPDAAGAGSMIVLPGGPGDHATSQGERRVPGTVTLVSGDRVTMFEDGRLAVAPRAGVAFVTYKAEGHDHVIPSDAVPLLAADRLDRRLFDVTTLLEAGYDKRDELPVIVAGAQQAPAGLVASRSLPLARGVAAKASRAKLAAAWPQLKSQGLARSPGYQKIWLDGIRKPTLDVSVPKIGAPAAWASGLDGAGVKVAVLDTGIDSTHADVAGRIAAAQNFTSEDALDRSGHGTHVASTIAGTGAASGGKYKGVAPAASLLDGKVCAIFGCHESWILAGMQWAADSGAQVVNMSLGGPDWPGVDPLEQAVNDLTASHGMLFVISAGNNGIFGAETVGSPGSADAALTVGAVDKNDVLAYFSSRGPRVGDVALKPDITAPGVNIVAARGKDAAMGTPGESYMPLSGTSMAAPHVTGAAAILAQQHPQWTPSQIKAALMGTAQPNTADDPFKQGAGRVDVARAITQNITASPASISLGRQLFPHEDDVPDARTVTYHNSGNADLTLQLSIDTTAPAEMFSLSSATLTVPAGGQASVTLTSDTRQGGTAYGHLGGRVVASADGVRVQTSFAIDREPTRYVLDLSFLDRAGQPAQDSMVLLFDPSTGDFYGEYGADTAKLRLPPGDYLMFSTVFDPARQHFTQFTQHSLPVDADLAMTLDARQASTYELTVPDRAAQPVMFVLTTVHHIGHIGYYFGLLAQQASQVTSVQLGPKQVDGLTAYAHAGFARPGPDGSLFNSKAVYQGSWRQDRSMYHGFAKHLAKQDLAKVEQSFRAQAGKSARHVIRGIYEDLIGSGLALEFSLPFQRDLFLTGDAAWDQLYYECTTSKPAQNAVIGQLVHFDGSYRTGHDTTENWGHRVQGPAFPAGHRWPYLERNQNVMIVDIPHFSDSAAHVGGTLLSGWQTSSATTALYRNGEPLGSFDGRFGYFEDLPADNARYKLEATMQRTAPFTTSTKVHTVWEFDSARPEQPAPLPVTAIGFAPNLDAHNFARTHQVLVVPVKVYQYGDAQPPRQLTISVSTDDGAIWRRVPVISIFGQTFTIIHNPATAGFVSLRAQATDRDGNTVDQTILRAYAVR